MRYVISILLILTGAGVFGIDVFILAKHVSAPDGTLFGFGFAGFLIMGLGALFGAYEEL